ncbi:RNA-binding S4 domain-containing protein [Solirubrobacter pauli]|nr:RNA-binding S4 domain-containing protein [Solirubrobacter pauli]
MRGVMMVAEMDDFQAKDGMIRLGQLLKASGLVMTGGEAKMVLAEERVRVNGELETRRGRQLHPGDVVSLGGESVRLT